MTEPSKKIKTTKLLQEIKTDKQESKPSLD